MDALKISLKVVCSIVAVTILGLVACPLWGQVLPQRKLTADDYHLWGTLQPEAVSDTGKWVSYYMTYQAGNDTLFVKSTSSDVTYAFARATGGQFNGDSQFLCSVATGGMALLDTGSGKITAMPYAESGTFAQGGRHLVTVEQLAPREKALVIRSQGGEVCSTIRSVNAYSWNTSKNAIAYTTIGTTGQGVGILRISGKLDITAITGEEDFTYHTLTWSRDGRQLAFYGDADTVGAQENILCRYELKSRQLQRLSASGIKEFPPGMSIGKDPGRALLISDDGKKVFFGLKGYNEGIAGETQYVEVWKGNDKRLYSEAIAYRSDEFHELAVWWPTLGKVRQITDKDTPFVMLAGNQDFALTGSSTSYDPQYRGAPDIDLYLTVLASGKQELLLKKQPGTYSQLRTSPDGNFIFYYKGSNWWSYSVLHAKHYNLTSSLSASLDMTEKDPANQFEVYGLGGYTKDKELLVYDYYDIWVAAPDGTAIRRLTNGRENKMQYRVVPGNEWQVPYNFSGASLEMFDFSKPVWLRTFDGHTNTPGYSVAGNSGSVIIQVTEGLSASGLVRAANNEAYICINQCFDTPPQIMYGDNIGRHSMVYQSNPHHFLYNWGKSSLIEYSIENGRELNAALYYPPGYDKDKKYPMIVYVYDIVSRDVNTYVNPTLQNNYGFNIAHLTANGYIVLAPDIMYGRGNTGKSAVECVEAAVRAVQSRASIDTSAIGLFGHSFGGYETNFIVSHSTIFAAAVSGSAVSDVVSAYFSIHRDSNTSDAWRYEKQQYRFGSMLYDNPDIYLENSPILFADKIKVPLLLFAGKKDGNVRHEQSVEMYLALRRLDKITALLLYPKEGHIILDPVAQADLTIRVGEWFDYYLKKKGAPDWILKGIK